MSATTREPEMQGRLLRLDAGILIGLCAAKFLLHVFTSLRHYGYFRDELYYLDLARHLDWGYVDCAPLIAVYAKIALLMGGSLAALRVIPALAGTALVALTIFFARELGGGRYAQLLAGLAILLCPAVLATDGLLTMNAVEPLFWTGCLLVIAIILRTGDSRLWIWFGVLAGLGLENKHSTLSFGFAVAVALLLTRQRCELAKPWIWIALTIALAIFLPNIIWEIRHHFPTIEDLANVRREGKNVVLGPLAFIKEQIIDMHPVLLPVWLAGLVWLLRERQWRLLGVTFVAFFVLMEVAHAKNYYVFPIYPMLFAAGAVVIGTLAGKSPGVDASDGGGRHPFDDYSGDSAIYVDASARASSGLSKCHSLQAGESRSPSRIAADAADCRSIWMAGNGERSGGDLQFAFTGRPSQDGHFCR
jgi:4-amino-4-deoxy-L-arabinose transferase-like glycosyltransferase